MSPNRCAAYARYSSDRQSPQSIDDQLRMCRNFAEGHGLEIVEDHVYTDAAVSGESDERLGLERLLGATITLQLEIHPEIGKIKVDRSQLEQAILNLAVNARDAMPAGGTLAIQARNVHFSETQVWQHSSLPPGSYVALTISDTGVGIDPDAQSRIFEPFFTTKAPGKGTGLGLSMVYGVVKQSDGAITVESVLGRGTTFKLIATDRAVHARLWLLGGVFRRHARECRSAHSRRNNSSG